ncbi:MAG: hypothetical protein J6W22_04515 [Fibrobacter sp.]|nr:hypothetical protein [Fibrobacter sp.]
MSLFEKKNSITVKHVTINKPFVFDPVDEGKKIVLKEDAEITLDVERYSSVDGKKKTRPGTLKVFFRAGFCTDGASTKKLSFLGIDKAIPPYIACDDVYNAAPFTHDGLYMKEGEIKGASLTRDECDDILRGIWRESGRIGRGKAFFADLGVFFGAGGKKHWGNDSDKCSQFFDAEFSFK